MHRDVVDLPCSLSSLAVALRERRLSPVEVVRAVLERVGSGNARPNAFITVLAEESLEAAARAEKEIDRGR